MFWCKWEMTHRWTRYEPYHYVACFAQQDLSSFAMPFLEGDAELSNKDSLRKVTQLKYTHKSYELKWTHHVYHTFDRFVWINPSLWWHDWQLCDLCRTAVCGLVIQAGGKVGWNLNVWHGKNNESFHLSEAVNLIILNLRFYSDGMRICFNNFICNYGFLFQLSGMVTHCIVLSNC